MAPPLPNLAHGDQLISAKPRGTARARSLPESGLPHPCWDEHLVGFKAIDSRKRGSLKAAFNSGRVVSDWCGGAL